MQQEGQHRASHPLQCLLARGNLDTMAQQYMNGDGLSDRLDMNESVFNASRPLRCLLAQGNLQTNGAQLHVSRRL